MALDKDKLLAAIDAAKDDSYGEDEQSSLSAKRALWLEKYLGLNTNPAPEGRSQVVDRSAYETIQVLLPSLVRIFASSSDEVCKFTPVGPEDEPAAEQTTAVINHIVTQQNQWEQICSDWLHDSLVLANGYAMAYWDASEQVIRENYEGQSEDQLAALLSDTNVRVIQHSQRPDEQGNADQQKAYQQALMQHQQTLMQYQMQAQANPGQPLPPPPQEPPPPPPLMLHDVVIERVENTGKVCIKVLAPEHCRISADTPDWTLKECPYFEYRQQKTIADLRSMGLEVPEDVSDDEDDDQEEDFARDRFGEDSFSADDGEGVMRRVWARMIWVRCDAEGDEVSRLYYVIAVGRTILYAEPTGRIPVASMTPQPLPHRHIGMSVVETVVDLQDIKTAVKRGGLDNLYLANNGRHVVSSRVNLDDFLDARPGGIVRMLDDSMPSEGHVMPLVHPFAFEQIIGSLEYFDQERQNRTGASRYFAGTDAGAINKTASGTIALQNMAAMRVEHIARMMAPAVEYLFEVVHEILSKHSNKPLTLKLRGQWTTVDPQAWRSKRDVRISVGVGAGNKESMMAQLAQLFGAQMQLLPAGIAGPQQLHATVTEMAKLAGFANPAKFWVDPSTQPPRPPQPDPVMMIEQAKLQQQGQIKQAELMQEQQLEAAKMSQEAQLKEREFLLEQQKAQIDAELEKYRIDKEAEVKLTLQGMQGPAATVTIDGREKLDEAAQMVTQLASQNSDTWLSALQALTQAVQTMTEVAQAVAAPKQVVRDAQGKVIGVQPVSLQ